VFVSSQSAFILTTTMASKVIKMKGFLSTRDRTNELSQSKFKCPFRKRDGQHCAVVLPFRHLSTHCKKNHKQEVGVKCMIDDCSWWCHKSLRCLTSHLSNTETHGALVIGGGPNLDGRVEVVPYEMSERLAQYHTIPCSMSTRDLCRFRSKMLKRNERAVAARMAESEVENIFPPIKTEQENFSPPINSEQENFSPPINSEQENFFPPIKSEKENFLNFGNQFKEMMSTVTGVFDDWEAFENMLTANNMRYCKPTIK
jgi:hypothetical protein